MANDLACLYHECFNWVIHRYIKSEIILLHMILNLSLQTLNWQNDQLEVKLVQICQESNGQCGYIMPI